MNNVRLIEIEIHSYCNRKCIWCPNSFIDRSVMQTMPEHIYMKILGELRGADYRGTISYSRYNEPLYDMELLKSRVAMAKMMVPGARLVTNTNGDYLSKEVLDGLTIDELTIMDYDCIGIDACIDKLDDCGVTIMSIDYPFISGVYGEMKILYYVDWPMHAGIEDRGGSLIEYSNERRTKPCLEPKYFIGIDYDGSVMPCCHMRSDNEKHTNYILGNVRDSSLEDIYNSEKAKVIREVTEKGSITVSQIFFLMGGNLSNRDYPCKFCTKDCGRYTRDNPGILYEGDNNENRGIHTRQTQE